MKIVPIVEGHGEVAALPVLLRRLASWISPNCHIEIGQAIRTSKGKFIHDPDEFGRMLGLARAKAGDGGWILILLDADDDCPVELSSAIRARTAALFEFNKLSTVISNREFEAWFIAAAESLAGCRSFSPQPEHKVNDPDVPRNAKGWLGRQMVGGYHEVTDQPAFAAMMSLEEAWGNSRSFRKLCSEFVQNSSNIVVT